MSNELAVQEQSFDMALMELDNMQKMSQKLLQMKHYQKLGDVGIFAILQKAKSVGLNPLDALNGGMYFVNGKVELASNTMNYLIREAGHSIIKDERSTKEICILRGKRKDNGDTFICSFSIDDAKKAGILKNVWMTYPEDMLFARALSRLARQLFPDVCKGCYTEGELPKGDDKHEYDIEVKAEKVTPLQIEAPIEYINQDQIFEINMIVSECDPDKRKSIDEWLKKKCNGGDLSQLPVKCFENTRDTLLDRRGKYKASLIEKAMNGEEVEDENN